MKNYMITIEMSMQEFLDGDSLENSILDAISNGGDCMPNYIIGGRPLEEIIAEFESATGRDMWAEGIALWAS